MASDRREDMVKWVIKHLPVHGKMCNYGVLARIHCIRSRRTRYELRTTAVRSVFDEPTQQSGGLLRRNVWLTCRLARLAVCGPMVWPVMLECRETGEADLVFIALTLQLCWITSKCESVSPMSFLDTPLRRHRTHEIESRWSTDNNLRRLAGVCCSVSILLSLAQCPSETLSWIYVVFRSASELFTGTSTACGRTDLLQLGARRWKSPLALDPPRRSTVADL